VVTIPPIEEADMSQPSDESHPDVTTIHVPAAAYGRVRFNPPPNWPAPPPGFRPIRGDFTPESSWPPPPDGWQLWVPDRRKTWLALAAVLVVILAIVIPISTSGGGSSSPSATGGTDSSSTGPLSSQVILLADQLGCSLVTGTSPQDLYGRAGEMCMTSGGEEIGVDAVADISKLDLQNYSQNNHSVLWGQFGGGYWNLVVEGAGNGWPTDVATLQAAQNTVGGQIQEPQS
jgi:hypothetical protein